MLFASPFHLAVDNVVVVRTPPPVFGVPQFWQIMTGKRFNMIKAAMRFVNSDRQYSPRVPKADVRYDKMWKVRHLLDHMNAASTSLLYPGQFISADEMMILATCTYVFYCCFPAVV